MVDVSCETSDRVITWILFSCFTACYITPVVEFGRLVAVFVGTFFIQDVFLHVFLSAIPHLFNSSYVVAIEGVIFVGSFAVFLFLNQHERVLMFIVFTYLGYVFVTQAFQLLAWQPAVSVPVSLLVATLVMACTYATCYNRIFKKGIRHITMTAMISFLMVIYFWGAYDGANNVLICDVDQPRVTMIVDIRVQLLVAMCVLIFLRWVFVSFVRRRKNRSNSCVRSVSWVCGSRHDYKALLSDDNSARVNETDVVETPPPVFAVE